MARSLWSGSITFGLVNVPVKLTTAVSPKEVHFHQLRASDGSRVQYKKVSATDQKEVPAADIIKGYQLGPNQIVKIKPEELDALNPEKNHQIEIERFVDLKQIDPIYYDHNYYLVPDEKAGKAYSLLLDAMLSSGKVGIAKMVLHNKEHVVALRGIGRAITLTTLYFADEIIASSKLELPASADKPSKKELDIALQLIEANAGKFEPENYKDEHRERVLELIQRKAEGKNIVSQTAPKTPSHNVVNLMDALKASLANSKKKALAREPAAKTKAKKTA